MAGLKKTTKKKKMVKVRGGASASPSSLFRRLVSSCKIIGNGNGNGSGVKEGYERIGCSASICNLREVVHGNTRVMHHPHKGETSPQISSTCNQSSRSLVTDQAFRRMHLKRWSGCYECHMIVDPIESFSRDTFTSLSVCACPCPYCGEIFTDTEALEHHQIIKHAVSELSEEDSARNVVEIIFQSSWLKKDNPICKIERILKIHNTPKIMKRFEEYRDTVKAKASKLAKKHARCIADGNELLRFHCAAFACSLGMNGSSSLCVSPFCNICNVIKNGFSSSTNSQIYTTASSGRAHDSMSEEEKGKGKRAMLVCRVIAGRVQRKDKDPHPDADPDPHPDPCFDSIAGQAGIYSNLDELFVHNPKAVLPCFVVIYKTLEG